MTEIPQNILSLNLGTVHRKFKESPYTIFTENLLRISFFDIEDIAKKRTVEDREKYGLIFDTGFKIYHLLVLYHQETQKSVVKRDNIKENNHSEDNSEDMIEVR